MKRAATKIKTEAWSSAFLTTTNVAPQSSEQMASDKSARKRLVTPVRPSRNRELAVFWFKRELVRTGTGQCNSVDQGGGALVSRAAASWARLALGPLGSS